MKDLDYVVFHDGTQRPYGTIEPRYRIRLLMDPWNAPSFEEASGQLGPGRAFERRRLSPFPVFETRPMSREEAVFRLGALSGWALQRWDNPELEVEHSEDGFISAVCFEDFRAEIVPVEPVSGEAEVEP